MWIIGDIHGCLTELKILLSKIPGDEKLLFVGDYVDRGPDSFGVIERLIIEKHRSQYLIGNHEEMMIEYLHDSVKSPHNFWLHFNNGGTETLKSYSLNEKSIFSDLPSSHQDFFSNLKLYYENDSFIAVHAGLRPNGDTSLEKQKREDFLWIRREWIQNESRWTGKHVYYGHTPMFMITGGKSQKEFITGKNSTGIDTGCVFGGYLSAINTDTKKIIQIQHGED